MADNANKGASAAAPKIRRGVSNQTQAVKKLPFHEKDAASNGLFIGHLAEVTLDWSVSESDSAFNGLRVPRVTLHFASNHQNVTEQRHVYQTLFPQPSNVDTIPGGKDAWRVDNVFNWIKHILDVFYLKGRAFTPEEEDALALNFIDYKEVDGAIQYEPVDTEKDVIPAYTALFQTFVSMMNGQFGLAEGETPKPKFKDAEGKFITCWIKLLRHKKVKGEWKNVGQNGELAFDGFIGNGVVELYVKDKLPNILRIETAKESITPKETKKTPTIGAPGTVVPGAVAIPGGMPMGNAPMGGGAFDAAGNADDMPF